MAESSASDWSEHTTPEGKKYFYNAKTGVSTWEKPAELKSQVEQVQASCPWTEHTSDNGRKYYYNTTTQTSSWEMPPEFKAMQEAMEAAKEEQAKKASEEKPADAAKPAAATAATPAVASPQKSAAPVAASALYQPSMPTSPVRHQAAPVAAPVVTPVVAAAPVFLTPADVFKSLLRDYHITPTATWDTTMRTIIKDERYKVLSSITERKAAFREYIEDVKTRDREERKAKEDALRNDFFAMLRQGEIDAGSTYRKAMTMFDRDPRWKAVDREKDREDLFDDYIWELETKQREEERNNRESNLKAFHQLLDEYVLSVTTQWRKFRDDVKDDPRYNALDKLDRLALFEHRIRDLERVEAEEKRKSRETQRRQCRKNRDAFRALLQEAYDAGKLDRNSKWKRFKRTIKEDPRYEDLIGQPGSTPSELYGDFVEDLQERYEETKRIIDRITKEGNITITSWMTEDQFLAAISTHPSYPNLDQPSASKIFAEMRDHVDRREKREKRKREKNFILMLKSHKDKITAASVYDDTVRELIAEEASYKAIPAEEERKALFESYVDHLKNRPADYESSSEEEGMIESESEEDRDRKRRHKDRKDKDRKRRRHSSKDRDDDKHKKRRKHSDKDKERKHKKSRGEEKKRGRREGSEEGELVPADHHAEKEEGEMDE